MHNSFHFFPQRWSILSSDSSAGFTQESASLNDEARFLAGMPVHNTALEAYSHGRAWSGYGTAMEMDKAFDKQEQRQIARVREPGLRAICPARTAKERCTTCSAGRIFFTRTPSIRERLHLHPLCGTEPIAQRPGSREAL